MRTRKKHVFNNNTIQ